jgi:hypothetical protein
MKGPTCWRQPVLSVIAFWRNTGIGDFASRSATAFEFFTSLHFAHKAIIRNRLASIGNKIPECHLSCPCTVGRLLAFCGWEGGSAQFLFECDHESAVARLTMSQRGDGRRRRMETPPEDYHLPKPRENRQLRNSLLQKSSGRLIYSPAIGCVEDSHARPLIVLGAVLDRSI